jgi:hypothetical protein
MKTLPCKHNIAFLCTTVLQVSVNNALTVILHHQQQQQQQQKHASWSSCKLPGIFFPIVAKYGFAQQILIKVSNIKFH